MRVSGEVYYRGESQQRRFETRAQRAWSEISSKCAERHPARAVAETLRGGSRVWAELIGAPANLPCPSGGCCHPSMPEQRSERLISRFRSLAQSTKDPRQQCENPAQILKVWYIIRTPKKIRRDSSKNRRETVHWNPEPFSVHYRFQNSPHPQTPGPVSPSSDKIFSIGQFLITSPSPRLEI